MNTLDFYLLTNRNFLHKYKRSKVSNMGTTQIYYTKLSVNFLFHSLFPSILQQNCSNVIYERFLRPQTHHKITNKTYSVQQLKNFRLSSYKVKYIIMKLSRKEENRTSFIVILSFQSGLHIQIQIHIITNTDYIFVLENETVNNTPKYSMV